MPLRLRANKQGLLLVEQSGSLFPAAHRLKTRQDFLHCKQMGRKLHTSHFLVFIEEKSVGPARLGITASRKVGNAVIRNRVKRLVREFFRLHYQSFGEGQTFSVIAKKSAARLNLAEVCNDLQILEHPDKWRRKSSHAR